MLEFVLFVPLKVLPHRSRYSPDNGGYLGPGGDDTPLLVDCFALHSTALNALHCSLVFDALDTLVVDSRGGKFSDFQGGVNVAAWAAGGLLPKSMHGTEVNGYIHICDCTFDYTLNCLCPGS